MTVPEFSRRFILAGTILLAHLLAIFGPVGCFMLKKKMQKPEEVPFRVKLGGLEPSHAPIVGEPERRRPSPDEGNVPPPPPQPPEQDKKTPAIPVQPKTDDQSARLKQKQLAEKKKKQAAEKKKRELAEKKRKIAEQKKREQQKQRRLAMEKERQKKIAAEKKYREQQKQRRLAMERERQKKLAEKKKQESQSVYHDSKWDNWDPNKPVTPPGGKNFNRNVKIGSQDRGQKAGKVDGRTPAGGATADEQKYWNTVRDFFMEKWQPPAGVFIDEETAVEITVKIDASGRVINKWITKRSPNAAVNASAELMLKNLTRIPRHPAGAIQFTLSLIQDN